MAKDNRSSRSTTSTPSRVQRSTSTPSTPSRNVKKTTTPSRTSQFSPRTTPASPGIKVLTTTRPKPQRVPSSSVKRVPMNQWKLPNTKTYNLGKANQYKPKYPVQPPKPGPQIKPQVIQPIQPKIDLGKLAIAKPVPVEPKTPLNIQPKGPAKLQGIKQFEAFIGKIDNNKLAPINLLPLNGKKIGNNFNPVGLMIPGLDKAPAKKLGIAKLNLNTKCHWWIDFVIGCNWQYNNCNWVSYCYQPGYWNCWTPCHFQVIECTPCCGYDSSSWYLGIDCILIPELAAYGIQEVMPNSPAAYAGLHSGDMLVSVNGSSITNPSVLNHEIQSSGGLIELGVIHNGSNHIDYVEVALWQVNKF
ncbi:MAG: PDZ domain-containing protein [Pirellulales bacterium]